MPTPAKKNLKSEKPESHQQQRIGDGRAGHRVEQLIKHRETSKADSGKRLPAAAGRRHRLFLPTGIRGRPS